jgi:putative photosynthetic complex assembly protein
MSALDDKPFPKAPLIGALVLVGATVLSVGAARLGLIETPASASAATPNTASPVISRDMRFHDLADGGIRVEVAGQPDEAVAPGTGGFVRGVLRSMVRDRRARGLGPEAAFRVTEWSDGTVTIEDLATQHVLTLNAFGPTNRQAFVNLMRPSETQA